MEWDNEELRKGKIIKFKDFPQEHKVKLFRVEVSTHRTDYVVTNDITQDSTEATHKVCPKGYRFAYRFRWRIEREGRWGFPRLSNHALEQLHHEGKQLTGWEK